MNKEKGFTLIEMLTAMMVGIWLPMMLMLYFAEEQSKPEPDAKPELIQTVVIDNMYDYTKDKCYEHFSIKTPGGVVEHEHLEKVQCKKSIMDKVRQSKSGV